MNRRTIAALLAFAPLVACSAVLGLTDPTLDPGATPSGDGGGGGDGSTSGDGNVTGDGAVGNDGAPTCNADLMTDKANCGKCAHDCTNGICTAGTCLLVDQLEAVLTIQVNDTEVFAGSANTGVAHRCKKNGCYLTGAPNVLPNTDRSVRYMAATNDHLFFANDYSNTDDVVRADLHDAGLLVMTAATPVTDINPFGIAIDDASVYWTNHVTDGSVMSCPRSGCTTGNRAILAPTQEDPTEILRVANLLVWGQLDGQVFACDMPSCSNLRQILKTDWAQGLATDGTNVYVADPGKGVILMCPIAQPCGATPQIIASNQGNPWGVAFADGWVYWTVRSHGPLLPDGGDPENGTAKKCRAQASCGGATPADVTARHLLDPTGIAVDSQSVYIADWGSNLQRNGSLIKVPR